MRHLFALKLILAQPERALTEGDTSALLAATPIPMFCNSSRLLSTLMAIKDTPVAGSTVNYRCSGDVSLAKTTRDDFSAIWRAV